MNAAKLRNGDLETLSITAYLRRLERLVRVLIGKKFESGDDLWRLQLDLLELQRDLQSQITAAKKVPRSIRNSSPARERLEEARGALWHARRFGDAIAWTLLGDDRRVIRSLGNNSRVPVPTKDHGHFGVIAIAQQMATEGVGFPLIHDVTDCLRIGDLTFIKSDRDILTVEVKTHMLSRQQSDDRTTIRFQATATAPSRAELLSNLTTEVELDQATMPNESSRNTYQRAERQLQRMSSAYARQKLVPNELAHLDGKPIISAEVETSSGSRWDIIRRIIRRARKEGYASECAEGTFHYVAFYDANGIRLESVQDPRLVTDIQASGLPSKEGTSPDSAVINAIPDPRGRGARPYMPYHLYSLPQRAIIDLLHGRLLIVIITNAGKLLTTLEQAGYEVAIPSGRNDLREGSLTVSRRLKSNTNGELTVRLPSLTFHILEMINEFRGAQYLIDVADGMSTVAEIAFNTRMERSSA